MYKIPLHARDLLLQSLLQEGGWSQKEVDQMVNFAEYLIWRRNAANRQMPAKKVSLKSKEQAATAICILLTELRVVGEENVDAVLKMAKRRVLSH